MPVEYHHRKLSGMGGSFQILGKTTVNVGGCLYYTEIQCGVSVKSADMLELCRHTAVAD